MWHRFALFCISVLFHPMIPEVQTFLFAHICYFVDRVGSFWSRIFTCVTWWNTVPYFKLFHMLNGWHCFHVMDPKGSKLPAAKSIISLLDWLRFEIYWDHNYNLSVTTLVTKITPEFQPVTVECWVLILFCFVCAADGSNGCPVKHGGWWDRCLRVAIVWY